MNAMQQKFASRRFPGADSAALAQRLKALSLRPQALKVRELIDRYMAARTLRVQRLAARAALIGDFILEQVDSDLIHAGRSELAQQLALIYLGLEAPRPPELAVTPRATHAG